MLISKGLKSIIAQEKFAIILYKVSLHVTARVSCYRKQVKLMTTIVMVLKIR